MERMPLLVTADELAELTASDASVRILDVRWRLDQPDGRPDYLAGHIPGAVFVDLDRELARIGAPSEGRHPLPPRAELEDAARRWGVNHGDIVIAYDDWNSISAARAWWLLSHSGVADVRVLDGGLAAWIASGRPLAHENEVPARRGDIVLDELDGGIATIDDAAAWPESGVLLDVRAPERYRGDIEPMDPAAGHIPGAVNLPAPAYLDGGRFLDREELRTVFADAGVTAGVPTAAYCGSGVTSAHTALAGLLAGIDIAVYPGSWSQWSNTPGRPIATGPEPGDAARVR
jgi:thiosulfate/3-mercaptopyruvate sulfurtransferase